MAGDGRNTCVNGIGDGYSCASSPSCERDRASSDEKGLRASTSGGDRPVGDLNAHMVGASHMHWACGGQVATSCHFGVPLASPVELNPAPEAAERSVGVGGVEANGAVIAGERWPEWP